MSSTLVYLPTDDLAIGHFVHLDLGWLEHPFPFNAFKILSQDQLNVIRGLRLDKVRVDLKKSTVVEKPAEPLPVEEEISTPDVSPAHDAAIEMKRQRIAHNKVLRTRINATEKQFVQAAKTCREIARTIFSNPKATIAQASSLIGGLADSLLNDSEAIVHLLGDKIAGEEIYHHALNVAMLALLLGRELKLERRQLDVIGLATLLHDIGKVEIPDRVLLKKDPYTAAERELIKEHVAYGITIAKNAGLDPVALRIIAEHHEHVDGSGYPRGLKDEAISVGGRVLALTNAYDNLCNPPNIANALTPNEALSLMFARQRSKYDVAMLGRFVRILGVYPPGTVVLLSNERVGMVLSINSAQPLRPVVTIYDAHIPKHEAMIVNLEQELEVSITKALRPSQLPRPIYDYLSPRQRVTYSFEQPGAGH
ncbi:MAG TPA: DUF3391 domain-containing protein [Accumulibacter sp.]|nr:DUF3391 domain-containing protein [Accumulibacter sp.]HMW17632.1 DUF3391 domain-containing protein [Accumulibacter sp.]HMX21734.1 DUF3391 domain-containing protein [Accumulibacter sp.]HMY05504.1 DUF3391 domain-containing protein [Accumulibacter sp.]HNC18297.1 DUF3391 domain-containing protein [Accumulibacter sp.]